MGLLEQARARKSARTAAQVNPSVVLYQKPMDMAPLAGKTSIDELNDAEMSLSSELSLPEPPPFPEFDSPTGQNEHSKGLFGIFRKKTNWPSERKAMESAQAASSDKAMLEQGESSQGQSSGLELQQPTVDVKKEAGRWQIFDFFKKDKSTYDEGNAFEPVQPMPSGDEIDIPIPEAPKDIDLPDAPEFADFDIPEPPSFDDLDNYNAAEEKEEQVKPFAEVFKVQAQLSTGIEPKAKLPAIPQAKSEIPMITSSAESEPIEITFQGKAPKPTKTILKMENRKKQLQDEIGELRKQILEIRKEAEEKMVMMEENERHLDEKESAIDQKLKVLETVKDQIEKAKSEIDQKSQKLEKIKALADQVYADRQLVEKMKTEFDEKEKAFAIQFDENRKMIDMMKKEMESKQQEMAIQQNALIAKEKEIIARENEVEQLHASIKEMQQNHIRQREDFDKAEFRKYIDDALKEIKTQAASVQGRFLAQEDEEENTNTQLVDYIGRHLGRGFKDERIFSALIGAGWSDDEVAAAMRAAKKQQNGDSLGSTGLENYMPGLQSIRDLLNQSRSLLQQRNIPLAQESLMRAKKMFDSIAIDSHKKELLRYEMQDLKTDIDLAMLS